MKRTGYLLWMLLWANTSCVTINLWENTNPSEKLFISDQQITAEELKAKGVTFIRYNTEWAQGFLIEKSALHKFQDYMLRLFATPVTLVLDTAIISGTVAVVGLVLYVHGEAGPAPTKEELEAQEALFETFNTKRHVQKH